MNHPFLPRKDAALGPAFGGVAGSAIGLSLCCTALCTPACAQTHAPSLPETAAATLEVTQTQQPPRDGAGLDATVNTTLWARRQNLAVGVGVEQTPVQTGVSNLGPTPVAAGMAQTLVLGVGYTPTSTTRVAGELPLAAPGATAAETPKPRLSMAFRPTNAMNNLAHGTLFKMEISRQTALSVRPRGGNVVLVVQSRW
jgi:hypothetical protein